MLLENCSELSADFKKNYGAKMGLTCVTRFCGQASRKDGLGWNEPVSVEQLKPLGFMGKWSEVFLWIELQLL